MLTDILKNKKCFKLICGAGNEDTNEIEKLVILYSKAGCNFFDLCAKPEIIDAAKKGLLKAQVPENRYLCCSVGTKNDPHISKAAVNSEKCSRCGICTKVCLQNALTDNGSSYEVKKMNCIGCGKCANICPNQAIEMICKAQNFKDLLPPIIEKGIDCIEFHISGEDEPEIFEKWTEINEMFDGLLSICINRSKLGNEQILKIINKMLKYRKPYSTVIQADGSPMSGGKDDFKTTLQTVAMAEIVEKANLPTYLLLSGGTNSKSAELAKICEININGVAVGSFARKIVREYIDREDFFVNEEIFNKALKIAKNLVDTSLKNM